ncbi:MAG: proteasome subunit alpha [Actinomycetota bacterium]
MSMPFYVAPEQVMKDRADFARKGIARGRALVAVEFEHGLLFAAENPSRSLHKTSEIYDRIGFAAVGRYNEFEQLRVAGIRLADLKGYQYAREDVSAKPLANAYSQALGEIFMGEGKPYEIELLIAEVGREDDGRSGAELYHILYDGSLVDAHAHVAIGGDPEPLDAALAAGWREGMSRDDAIRLAVGALRSASDDRALPAMALEVSGLDRRRERRCFFRIPPAELSAIVGSGG